MTTQKKLPDDAPLEKVVERLESIVEELESGEADLEKSINLFREGKKLGKRALKSLDQLERKVELVLEEKDGALETQTFETPE